MKKTISIFAIVLAVLAFLAISCVKESGYPGKTVPKIELMMEELHPDLNRVDNTPVVCVIFSETGLSKVELYIVENDVKTKFSEVTTFHDIHQYSMKESPTWHTGITAAHIKATDRAGRVAESTMNVVVTPVLPAPEISFNYEEIVIDEKKEDPSSLETSFTVVSSTTLDAVSAKLFREDGTVDLPLTPSFTPGDSSYTFTQVIDYLNGDRALQVTATDVNGKMKIETLPIKYIPAPAPEFTPTGATTFDPIAVRSTDSRTYTFNVATETGLSAIQAFKVIKDDVGVGQDILLDSKYYDASTDFSVDYSFTFDSFDAASHAIKFVATDRLNHFTTITIPAYVDLRIGMNLVLGSQYNAKTPLILEGSDEECYCFFSVMDFKTYSLFYYWNPENRRNIDFFYFSWNYGSASDNGSRLMRANEDRSGQDAEGYLAYKDPENPENDIPEFGTGSDWGSRNGTQIKKIGNTYTFNFENATVADLTTPQIANLLGQAKTSADWVGLKAGDELVFKTGPLSTCPNCVGIIRVESVVGSRTTFGKEPVYFEISIKAQVVE